MITVNKHAFRIVVSFLLFDSNPLVRYVIDHSFRTFDAEFCVFVYNPSFAKTGKHSKKLISLSSWITRSQWNNKLQQYTKHITFDH